MQEAIEIVMYLKSMRLIAAFLMRRKENNLYFLISPIGMHYHGMDF